MIHGVVIFIFSLWILQGFMAYWQIINYRKTLSRLKTKGKVYIGEEKGKLKAGSIVLIAVDENNMIIDVQEMKGFTVFNRFKSKDLYIGKTLDELFSDLSKLDKDTVTTKAMKKSLKDFSIS